MFMYHPQMDIHVDRFSQTLQEMLKQFMASNPKHWGQLLPLLLFVIREALQVSPGSPPLNFYMDNSPKEF